MSNANRANAGLAFLPPVLVAVAAMLWGTDGLWRTELLRTGLTAPLVVFWEHVLLVAATGWLLWRDRGSLRRLGRGDWLAVLVIGMGASAVATVLFTQAFLLASPTTVLLLQKTQPLVAISLAAVLLREPLPGRFWPLLPVALVGAYLISFGDTGPLQSLASVGDRALGAACALGAAAFWGAGTVLGRRLLGRVSFLTLTALRFATALPALAIVAGLAGAWAAPSVGQLPPLLMLSLVAGLIGLLLYYRGLHQTPAAVATLCELSFPITAILISVVVQGTELRGNQVLGIALLWGALALMRHRPVEAAPAPVAAASASA